MDMSGHDKFNLPKEAEPYVATAQQADARWAAKLGLKPGEKPVSMVDVVVTRKADGTLSVGG